MGPYQQVAGLHSSAPCCCSTGGGGGDRGICTPCHIRDCLAVRDGSAAFLFARGALRCSVRVRCTGLGRDNADIDGPHRQRCFGSLALHCVVCGSAVLLVFWERWLGGRWHVCWASSARPSIRPSVHPIVSLSPSLPPSLSLSLSLSQNCGRCRRTTKFIRVCPPPLIASCVPSSAVCSSVAPI